MNSYQFDLFKMLKIIFKGKFFIFIVVLGAALVGLLYSNLTLEDSYETKLALNAGGIKGDVLENYFFLPQVEQVAFKNLNPDRSHFSIKGSGDSAVAVYRHQVDSPVVDLLPKWVKAAKLALIDNSVRKISRIVYQYGENLQMESTKQSELLEYLYFLMDEEEEYYVKKVESGQGDSLKDYTVNEVNPSYVQLKNQAYMLEMEIFKKQNMIDKTGEILQHIRSLLGQLNNDSNIDEMQTVINEMSKQVHLLNLRLPDTVEELSVNDIKILSEPETRLLSNRKTISKNTVAAAVLGLILACLVVLGRNFFIQSIKHQEKKIG